MMEWDGSAWNVYHEEDNEHVLWISCNAPDAVLPGEHRWTFYDDEGNETHECVFETEAA